MTYPLIFVHIPKAGGTTLVDIFRQNYRRSQMIRFDGYQNMIDGVQSRRGQLNMIKLIYGHFATGLDQHISTDLRYFTFLREPVQRVISHYNYVRRSPQVQAHDRIKNLSLKEYISTFGSSEGNLQARLITGIDHKRDWSPGDLFAGAKSNLEKKFICFGILEQFDESLVLFKEKLTWKTPLYVKQNVSSDQAALDKETEELIAHHNSVDIQLYQYAAAKFSQEIKRVENFDEKLRRMRNLNWCYQPIGRTYSLARSIYFKINNGSR